MDGEDGHREGLPDAVAVARAARRLRGRVRRTPLLGCALLDRHLGLRLLVKAESLQHTGSFKIRGALNRILAIPPARRRRGVVAYSSGNHAQAVAAAAAALGVPATVVMPADAPPIKLARTRAHGARIVTYDRRRESREAIGEALSAELGATLVRPYDDPEVIAGQGTVGLEIAAQCEAAGLRPDAVLVPCGGGGLAAGCALALPGTAVLAVEPAACDDTARSLAAGRRVRNPALAATLCDALQAPEPGALTFEINRRLLAGACTVEDREVVRAMAVAAEALHLVLEPSGAAALAAALAGRLPEGTRTAVVVASGGNVEGARLAALLRRAGPVKWL
ncbi:pyridoxal-phosphate dependent enzyme [Inmirania thermothiophila]|uniref:Threonine dehydratase n=1 Tax=Inmirania thermothiophila TaxID=1750597 RepID=A0A3N1Y653_9GAMM|nr:pyridoxal-phosphate dependent enzyme [Inmirania thermothiophila]ROR34289.1 threonine dehydratase [Inmirania thermothiophila]